MLNETLNLSLSHNLCFVLGMHRSGTSFTAGLLEGMGLSAGRDVMAASSTNPLGHYENNAIVRFHNDVLAAMGSVWHDSCPLAGRLRSLAPTQIISWRKDLVSILQAQFNSYDRAVIKDPRLCRLLPLWAPIVSDSKWPIVLVIRHPAAVAGSLHTRNKFAAVKALSLWLSHNLEMERETRDYPREFVFYPEILDDPKSSCRRLTRCLGIDFPEVELDSLVQERVRSELCHENKEWPEAPTELIHQCEEVFFCLQQHAGDTKGLDEIYQKLLEEPHKSPARTYSIKPRQSDKAREFTDHDVEVDTSWNQRTEIINNLIVLLRAKSYLEIGVEDGNTFNNVKCDSKVGVDPEMGFPMSSDLRCSTFNGTFLDKDAKFDLIFINTDGHKIGFETNLIYCLGSLNPGGVVVCHHLNPTGRVLQRDPGQNNDCTPDSWKAWVRLHSANQGLAMVVFDTDCGVGVIMPGRLGGPILSLNEKEVSWTVFDRLRVPWLNLMSVTDARRFVTERILESDISAAATLESGITHTSSAEKSKETFLDEFDSQREEAAVPGTASAVLLFGVVHRSLPHVIHSLRKQLIEELARHGPVHIFFHSWSVPTIKNPRGREMDVSVDADVVLHLLPEARGVFESQEDFDETMNWKVFTSANPMRPFCSNDEEARITLMNLFRAAESLERVWRFFESTKQTFYRRVVVARPDVRFLERLPMPAELMNFASPAAANGRLWIPRFHCWDGLNDRFVMGQENEVRIWCQRREFLEKWLRDGDGGTSESLLTRWLSINQVLPVFLKFVFQRVRANGRIEKIDQKLGNKWSAAGNSWNICPIASARWSEPPVLMSASEWPAGLYRQQEQRSRRGI